MPRQRQRRPRLRIELPELGLLDPFRLRTAEFPPGSGQYCVWSPVKGGEDKHHDSTHEGPREVGPEVGPEVGREENVRRVSVERAGLCLAGASEALFHLSFRWMRETGAIEERHGAQRGDSCAGSGLDPRSVAPVQMRLALERREGRLLAALLRRHLRRLPQPAPWMATLLRSLEEMDDYLSWQEPSVR